jgi:biopolymer transport protein ExbD
LLYTFNQYKESKIKVNLPRGVTNVQPKGENPVVVNITAKNEIYLGDSKVTLESLQKDLSAFAENAKKNGLVVKADKNAAVDNFVKVLDAAKQAGIDKLGVSIELEQKK